MALNAKASADLPGRIMKPAGAGWEDFGGIEIADENVVEFGDSVAALSGDFEQADVGQRTVVELCRSLTRVVEIFELVEVGFGDGGFEAHADGASDGRTESSEDHVASGDGLDGRCEAASSGRRGRGALAAFLPRIQNGGREPDLRIAWW
jgi:hypothetical protein